MEYPMTKSQALTPHNPDPVDIHVGRRLRIRRVILGLGQHQLGAAVGVSFQQIQKYERGHNRISASRLFDLADALGVPIDYFFRDLTADVAGRSQADAPANPPLYEHDPRLRAETLDLVEAYWHMPDDTFRRSVLDLVGVLGTRR